MIHFVQMDSAVDCFASENHNWKRSHLKYHTLLLTGMQMKNNWVIFSDRKELNVLARKLKHETICERDERKKVAYCNIIQNNQIS